MRDRYWRDGRPYWIRFKRWVRARVLCARGHHMRVGWYYCPACGAPTEVD